RPCPPPSLPWVELRCRRSPHLPPFELQTFIRSGLALVDHARFHRQHDDSSDPRPSGNAFGRISITRSASTSTSSRSRPMNLYCSSTGNGGNASSSTGGTAEPNAHGNGPLIPTNGRSAS